MFRQLTLLGAAGLIGPILSSGRRSLIPVVMGELAAGAIIGKTGFELLEPHASVFPVFYSVGFATLMMTAGTHVDVRSPAIRTGAAKGAMALAVVLAVVLAASVPLGLLISSGLGVGHQLLLIVLLGVALPRSPSRSSKSEV